MIFILGPCEPLIPLLMYPAAHASLSGLLLVTLVFAVVTVTTMMLTVLLVSRGIKFERLAGLVPLQKMERHAHTMAGLAIFGSGLAIQFLGL